VAPTALRLVFQNLLQEQDAAVAEASQALWSALLQRLGASGVAEALPPDALEVRCCRHVVNDELLMSTTSSFGSFKSEAGTMCSEKGICEPG
jgi:hypothetical protein